MNQTALDEHEAMCNSYHKGVPFGGRVDSVSIVGPAAQPTRDVLGYCEQLVDDLRPKLKKEFQDRPLFISIVGDGNINAAAGPGELADHVLIKRGLIEHLFGAANALFAAKSFLMDVGKANGEQSDTLRKKAVEFRISILGPSDSIRPNCLSRSLAAELIAQRALRFCVLHELGHIYAKHRTPQQLAALLDESIMSRAAGGPNNLIEGFEQVIVEHDADMFAGTRLRGLVTQSEVSQEQYVALGWRYVPRTSMAAVLEVLGVYLLFKILSPNNNIPSQIDPDQYPPVMVRAFNAIILIELGFRQGLPPQFATAAGQTVAERDLADMHNWFGAIDGMTELNLPAIRQSAQRIAADWSKTVIYFQLLFPRYAGNIRALNEKQRLDFDWRT